MSAQPHGLSGQQIAKSNLLKFQKWIIQRDLANDWISYLRGEKLNRSEIASESLFFLIRTPPEPSHQDALKALKSVCASGIYREDRSNSISLETGIGGTYC
jgi:hypothetical protein